MALGDICFPTVTEILRNHCIKPAQTECRIPGSTVQGLKTNKWFLFIVFALSNLALTRAWEETSPHCGCWLCGMQALLVQDALKRQEPYLQIKPLMHLLFISASTNIHTDYYFSYQRTQSSKQRAQAGGKPGVTTWSLTQAKPFHSNPFCFTDLEVLHTQSLGKS